MIVGSQAPRSKEPDSDDVREHGDDDFDEQRNDDADDERQDASRREDQAHVCVAFKARAYQGHLEASPELPYHRGVTGVAEVRLGSGNQLCACADQSPRRWQSHSEALLRF